MKKTISFLLSLFFLCVSYSASYAMNQGTFYPFGQSYNKQKEIEQYLIDTVKTTAKELLKELIKEHDIYTENISSIPNCLRFC